MNKKISIIIFILLSVLYISFGYGVTVSNDSVTNIDQIVSLDLWHRSSHFGFHLFGIIFYLIFSKIIGMSAVTSVEIMLAIVSAASSVALYQIVLKKYNNINQAIVTVVIYALSSGVISFSCQVEYLVLVPSFGLISLYFYTRDQNIIAGIFFGLGLLTSFLVVLFTPIFFLFTAPKDIFKKHNLIFAVSVIVVFFSINLFTLKETVSGSWSYGGELSAYIKTFGDINFLRPAAILVYGYLRSFNVIILLLPFTFYFLFKNNRELFLITLIIVVIHIPFAIPEARYFGYQMTAYPVVAIASAFYLTNIIRSSKWIIAIVFIFSSLNIYIVFTERSFSRDLKDTYVALNNDLDSNSVLIVYQAVKPIKNIYASDLQVHDILSDYQNKMAEKRYTEFVPTDLNEILSKNDVIYLLESGVSMPDDNLKLMVSNFTKNQGAKVKGFALDKILAIDPTLKIEKLNQYSLDVYKISKTK